MQEFGELALADPVTLAQKRHDSPLAAVMPPARDVAVSMSVAVSSTMPAARGAVHEVHTVVQLVENFFCVVYVHVDFLFYF